MTNLCIQIEGYVSPFADQLPKVVTTDLVYVERFEEDSYAHWVFGGNSSSLVDKVNSRSLTVQAGTPFYNTNNVRVSSVLGNALLSDLVDTASEYTATTLVLPSNTQINVVVGALGNASDAKGAGVYLSTNLAYFTSRTGVSSLNSGATINPLQPVLVSFSVNKSTGILNFLVAQNGVTYEKTQSLGTIVESLAPLAFGNSRYSGTHSAGTVNYYEGILHNRALSLDEMRGVAERMRIRQQENGVIF